MKKRIDPYSGEEFYPKRNNQKFSCRENQIAFNNERARKARNEHSLIDNQIRNNYQILADILSHSDLVIKTKEFLLAKGYNFSFMNNYRSHNDKSYYGVYNYGFRSIGEGKYELVKFNKP